MSFQQPLYLLGLLLVPVGLAAFVVYERRRAAAADRFVARPLRASVAPWRPGWRRRAPLAAYGLALVALMFSLARPQATVAVPVDRAAIILASDYSGSMQATDVAPSRLEAARSAVERFLDDVPPAIRVGLIGFNQAPRTLQTPTTDREAVRAALRVIPAGGGTATGEALAASLATLEREEDEGGRRAPGAIVLLSDGASTSGRDPLELARRARRLRIPVYTVALGTSTGSIEVPTRAGGTVRRPVPPDTASLARIAEASGGQAFSAADAPSLSAVYRELGSQLGRRDEEREITSAFAGGALILLIAGASMSLHWFRRLP